MKAYTLDELSALTPVDFVRVTYDTILNRSPTPHEQEEMLSALLSGDARTWLVGKLRYGAEGRVRRVHVPGLWMRYAAQRLFRVPGVGPVLQWINAVARLPSSLRHLRAVAQSYAARSEQMRQRDHGRMDEIERRHDDLQRIHQNDLERLTALERRHDDLQRIHQNDLERLTALERRHDELQRDCQVDFDRTRVLERRHDELQVLRQSDLERMTSTERKYDELLGLQQSNRARADDLESRLDTSVYAFDTSLRAIQGTLDPISPPALGEVLEIPGAPLVALARERFGLSPEVPLSTLTRHQRYAMFETVFYESPAVAAKQRVYVPYLNHELTGQLPFLDLGCGRGEFLRILRDEGLAAVGVDINPTGITRLRAEGFDVVEQDLLTFLDAERRTFCGASLLQVAEHLTDREIEQMLLLVAARLAPGAVFILETPNPLSGFALGVFHTDSTHLRPLPPERMRYEIEAAGFEQSRTLFQARIPRDQYAGTDPRAYYMDYAIIASRASR